MAKYAALLPVAHLIRSPWLVAGAKVDLLVHPLEHKLRVPLIAKCKDTFRPVDIIRFCLKQVTHKLIEHGNIKQSLNCEPDGGYKGQIVDLSGGSSKWTQYETVSGQ